MPAADAPFQPLRIPTEMYERMIEAGVFDDGVDVELLDGELIKMSPQGNEHATLNELLGDRARSAFGAEWAVFIDKPLFCGGYNLPEPDLFVVKGPRRQFLTRRPRANETALVVEVAVSSQAIDRKKAAAYATAGAPVYWLLDVAARTLTVYSQPAGDGYGSSVTLDEGGIAIFPTTGVTVVVRDLLA